jgi:hypothetical protein
MAESHVPLGFPAGLVAGGLVADFVGFRAAFAHTAEYLLCAVLVVVTAALVLVALVGEGTSTVDERVVSADD